ncbi:MAG: hypothetical protein FWG26_09945 [Betaproteobacteria bacterium]|jgi:hypothetical protein|nr:hypothetical protein [Betaproteobacteria bacterium]
MKPYLVFSILAFAFFSWAQYNGYSLFDSAATGRATGQTDARTIFHK